MSPELEREGGEPSLDGVELGEIVGRHLAGRDLRRKPFELRADEERLPELGPGDRPHANATVRLERHEPERGEAPERLANGRATHGEPLGELLLPENGPRRDHTRDDLVLEDTGEIVGLRGDRRVHAGSVERGTASCIQNCLFRIRNERNMPFAPEKSLI